MAADFSSLKKQLGSGLLAFPATPFKDDLTFDEANYRQSIAFNIDNGAVGLFAPGGTGEFFSVTLAECARITRTAVEVAKGKVPIIAGVGYGTMMAVEFAKAAEAAGAQGVLVLPPYLLNVEQAGLEAHIDAICRAVGIGVIVYNRDNSIYATDTVARLADRHANLIGFKDGHGDVEQLVRVRQTMGDRLVLVGGMPTAETYAVPYFAAGFTTYSSAVYNFIPKVAQRFYAAVKSGDSRTTDEILQKFFMPYIALRNRRRGYAVSIVKAGMKVMGRPTGPVRPPLTDLSPSELEDLGKILHSAFAGKAA
jgi:5-dehydro-4-deoxyglucarate dehydratase